MSTAAQRTRDVAGNLVGPAVDAWNAAHPDWDPVFLPLSLRYAIGQAVIDGLAATSAPHDVDEPPVPDAGEPHDLGDGLTATWSEEYGFTTLCLETDVACIDLERHQLDELRRVGDRHWPAPEDQQLTLPALRGTGRTLPGELIDEDQLIDQIVQEIEGDELVIGGSEWTVEETRDANVIELVELSNEGTDGRRLHVRIDVEVSEA